LYSSIVEAGSGVERFVVVTSPVVSVVKFSVLLPGEKVGIKVGLEKKKGKIPSGDCGWVRSQIESTTTTVQADTRTLIIK
jgi:hypothetical protein